MGKGSTTTTNSSTSSPAPQAAAAYSSLLNQAQNVASTPYQAYTGELTAPVNAQQQQGISGINAAAGQAQPAINTAEGIAGAAATPLTASQIQQYQNPYTQDVVNATEQQFNNQNNQQQAALTGNNIAQGALGGNRVGVAQANLAGQQAAAEDPTIAAQYQQSYNTGLSTAENQFQTNPLNAAGSIANFGVAGQNAALTGAGAQLGAGTVEQQTQQAADTANYGQYAQAQAYPFQALQYQAGIDTAVGPGLGSTSTGQTTGPAPNQTAQYLGAGIAGAGLALSDRRLKEDVHKIGAMHDGQPLYRYRYKGDSEWHIGPMAQDVERDKPDAVHHGLGGVKYVDLERATDDSIGKASGGGVGSTPWSFANGWVPSVSGLGHAAPPSASAPAAQNPQTPNIDWSKLGTTASQAANNPGLSQFNPSNPFLISGAANPFSASPASNTDAINGSMSILDSGSGGASYGPGFARGGVAGYADGGATFDERFSGEPQSSSWDYFKAGAKDFASDAGKVFSGDMSGTTVTNRKALMDQDKRNGYADGGSPADDDPTFDQRFYGTPGNSVAPSIVPAAAPPDQGVASAVVNPDEPYRMPDQGSVDAWRANNPIPPQGTPPAAPSADDDDTPLPPQITGQPSGGVGGATALGYAPSSGVAAASPAPAAPTDTTATTDAPTQNKGLGIGLGLISPNAQTGLLAAGLGMLASRASNLGNAIGEGGIAGLTAYGAAQKHDEDIAAQAAKLSKEAKDHADEMKQKQQTIDETARHNVATEKTAAVNSDRTKYVPAGTIMGSDGVMHPIVMDQTTGKMVDGVTGKPPASDATVIAKGAKTPVSDEDAKAIAEYYVKTGDRTRLQGLGVSGEAKQKVNHQIAQVQKDLGVSDEELGTRVAEFEGRKAGERTLGTQEAKMGSAAFEAEGAIKQARGVIERLPRTSFLPLNKLVQGYQNQTLNPDQAELYGRTQAIVNTYSAVMSRGANVTTDSARAHANDLLNTAGDPATYNRMLDTMMSEINMAKNSPERMRQFYREKYGPQATAPANGATVPPAAGATAPATTNAIPPPDSRVDGQVYTGPNGRQGRWNAAGQHWDPVP